MRIELTKVKVLMENSDETICFAAELRIDGKKAATVNNSGNGEANRYYFDDS